MVNYYEVLNIEQGLGIEEINHQLTKLEQTWTKREVTAPDKARVMLTYISEARDIFKSEASRHDYEVALAKSKEMPIKTDPNEERRAKFNRWYEDAMVYYRANKYDLAKVSIEKAYSYYDQESENGDFFYYMADIYNLNNDYISALNFINQAIVINHRCSYYYVEKAMILWNKDPIQFRSEILNAFDDAMDYAIRDENKYGVGSVHGFMAKFKFHYGSKPNESLEERYNTAEAHALKALEFVEKDENAQWVLDSLNRMRREAEERKKAEEERRIREEKEREEREEREAREREERRKKEEQERKLQQEQVRQAEIKRLKDEENQKHYWRVNKLFGFIRIVCIIIYIPWVLYTYKKVFFDWFESGKFPGISIFWVFVVIYLCIIGVFGIATMVSDVWDWPINIAAPFFSMMLFAASSMGASGNTRSRSELGIEGLVIPLVLLITTFVISYMIGRALDKKLRMKIEK